MESISWRGPIPPRALVATLAAAGYRVTRGRGPGVLVVATAASLPPRAPGDGPWIWLCPRPVPLEAAEVAIARGAYDVLDGTRAADGARLIARLQELAVDEPPPPATPGVIAQSAAARRALHQAWRAARTSMPVLLAGDTGSGKEVLASLIHEWSRRTGPYVTINCAAIPNELMESELFGHVRGAFSGAVATVDGKLLAAADGTVFLDEIDDTPISIQAKLLRALEEGEVTRVGETRPRRANFRFVAATNQNLLRLVAEGRFGLDFYERLAIVRIDLPRLADRREDIPAFVRHFIARFHERQEPVATRVEEVAPAALEALARHPWPGNIRELRNVIFQALVYKRAGRELLLSDVRPALEAARVTPPTGDGAVVDPVAVARRIDAGAFNLRRQVLSLEAVALEHALARAAGSPTEAARLLGQVGRGRSRDPGGTVRAMMRRLGVAGGRASARRNRAAPIP